MVITKPVLFAAPMVKAILEGRKSMTRRLVKPQPAHNAELTGFRYGVPCFSDGTYGNRPYNADDILYVRETWQYLPESIALDGSGYIYKASESGEAWEATEDWTWRPSIHMPKEAARLFLRVTDVCVERLRDIIGNLDDLEREGINIAAGMFGASMTFSELWDSFRKPKELQAYGWDANPWVWVVSFERCDKP